MSLLDGARHVLRTLTARQQLDAETREELAFHLEQQTRKHVAAGHSRSEAERRARLELGGLERWRDETNDARAGALARDLDGDARYAFRGLLKRPAFTIAALSTLAIGIGATSAIFAVVDGALLQPLPYPNASRVMSLSLRMPQTAARIPVDMTWSYPKFGAFQRGQRSFAGLALHSPETMVIGNSQGAERLSGEAASATYFPILGVRPAAGRVYTADEDRAGGDVRVVVLSDAMWRTRFGSRGDLLGKPMVLNGTAHRIIGIMPPGFTGLSGDALYWVPIHSARSPRVLEMADAHNMQLLGLLAPGVTAARAQQEITAAGPRINAAFDNPDWGAAAYTLDERRLNPTMRRSFLLLGVAVGLLLLIVCVNLSTLLLTRSAARREEFAIRVALGAGRMRVARQLLVESSMLALLGLILGLAFATVAVRTLVATLPLSMPNTSAGTDLTRLTFSGVSFDMRAVVFAAGLSVVLGIAIGLLTVARFSTHELAEELRRARTTGRADGVLAGGRLAAVQIALAVVFLVTSGMTITSLRRTLAAPIGFEPAQLLTARITLDPVRARTESTTVLWDGIVRELRAIPGVVTVGVGSCMPIGMRCDGSTITPQGRTESTDVGYVRGSAAYFEAIGTPIVRGRGIEQRDIGAAERVAVVNETAVRAAWGGQDPFTIPLKDETGLIRIVGVAKDARYGDIERPARATVFVPFNDRRGALLVRTGGPVDPVAPLIRAAVRRAGAGHAIGEVRSMADRMDDATARPRLMAQIFAAFAVSSLLLAAIGVYGTLALQVAQRAREFAIRRALGATASSIGQLVARRAAILSVVGLVIGIAAALALGRTLSSLLYDVQPVEGGALAVAAAVLILVVASAAAAPTIRSLRADPREAMRSE